MKDENDNITQELFIEKPKLLKGKNNDFQRLHIEKLVKGGVKPTTVSIERLSYEFLALKLGATPHTREANKKIKEWIVQAMEAGEKAGTYDPEAQYNFSAWLKRVILWEVVADDLARKWWDDVK